LAPLLPPFTVPVSFAPLAKTKSFAIVPPVTFCTPLNALTKEALPVIRYRTRDLTRLLPGSARTMRRIEKITGRSDDMLIIRGVNVFPSQIEELILKQPALTPHYVLELSKDGPLDHLTVLVEGAPEGANALRHSIKSYIGISADVKALATGGIERSVGKAKRVIDRRPR